MIMKEILDEIQRLNKIKLDNDVSRRSEFRKFMDTLLSYECWPEFIIREITEHNSFTKYEVNRGDLLELLHNKYHNIISNIEVDNDLICIEFKGDISTGYFPRTDLDKIEEIAYGEADPSDIQDRIDRKTLRIKELENQKKEEIDYYNGQITKENDEINKLKSYL